LDYTGYPVESLSDAERFYSRTMALGTPYRDEAYRGWWSADAVFGVYEASPDDDGIPTRGRANGYVSFWVPSADAALRHLRAQGSTVPIIAAINSRPGIDREDGYVQVVATDSEGNLLLLSEYPGD
ncbi:MAG: hypothetical protein IT379_17565, partial [Deltaproteobacteria bacterium]|nr:hypothetical protein [Deltaproteobacteria bacterium]